MMEQYQKKNKPTQKPSVTKTSNQKSTTVVIDGVTIEIPNMRFIEEQLIAKDRAIIALEGKIKRLQQAIMRMKKYNNAPNDDIS